MAKNDPELPKINLNLFVAGESIDTKNGGVGGFYKSQSMDFRQKASQMTVLPGLYNIANNLKDLITCMDQDLNGIRYAVGSAGYVYRINTSNVVSLEGQLDSNGGAGCYYNPQNDNLYMSSQQSVSLYGQLTNSNTSPTLRVANFGPSASIAPGVIYILDTATLSYDGGTDSNTGLTTQRNNLNTLTTQGLTPTNYASQVTNTLTNTYTLPSSISESSGNYCTFIPDIEPAYSVAVYVTTVGSGNWTLTMHDSLNNNLGSATISHSNIVVGWNNFVFSSPGIRMFINAIASNTVSTGYHFHLTSSASNDTAAVATIAANNLNGCNMVYFAYRLVSTQNGWHPMHIFGSTLFIGNGRYVSTYNFGNDSDPNNSQWVRHAFQLDIGHEVTSITDNGQNAVILAERRSTVASRQYQGGYLYTWDGTSQTWIQRIPVPMGSPYSAWCMNNIVYFYCAGSLLAWGGGTTIIKVRYIAYQNTDYLGTSDTTIVNPNMMTTRYNLLLMGYPTSTTNVNVNMGIYTWGSIELIYPNSFGYSYTANSGITNHTSSNNFQIGMVENFVDTLYMSSQYTDSSSVTHYQLDVLDNTSSVAPTFSWTSLIWDGGVRYKMKKGLRVKVSFTALPTGITITPWFSIDRGSQISADPNSGTSYQVGAGATNVVINIPQARSHELQWGFTGTAAAGTTTSPEITGVTAEIDGLDDEPDLRGDG